jgi:hypothetical protein
MAEEVYPTTLPENALARSSWGAIFAGTFAALAVWATFGALGLAIFSSNANPNAPRPLTGMPVGEGFWIVILSMIALYVGGRVTASLADVRTKTSGVIHGFVMFGLSTFAALLISAMIAGSATMTTAAATGTTHSPYLLNTIAGGGYIIFIACLLGGCTAMWGAAHGLPRVGRRPGVVESPEIRRVA